MFNLISFSFLGGSILASAWSSVRQSGSDLDSLWDSAESGSCESIRALHRRGVDLNAPPGNSKLPLVAVLAEKGNSAGIRVLHELGANLDIDTFGFGTPLAIAISGKNKDAVVTLIELRVDPVMGTPTNNPLYNALIEQNFRMIRLLVTSFSDLNQEAWETPVKLAAHLKKTDSLRYLNSLGVALPSLNHADYCPHLHVKKIREQPPYEFKVLEIISTKEGSELLKKALNIEEVKQRIIDHLNVKLWHALSQ